MASFTDANGTVWTPKITGKVIRRFGRETGLMVSQLTNMQFDVGVLIDLCYYAVENQAKERGLSLEQFLDLLEGNIFRQAVIAIWEAIKEMFPEIERAVKNGPFDLGSGETS